MRRLTLALVLLPAPALAQEARTFQPPQGCSAYVTVQMSACTVSHLFTCDVDPEGWQRRVDMDEGGVTYFGAIDAETQWLESTHVLSEHSERLAPAPADPASFTELLASGRDGFDFTTLSDEIGTTRYVGEDRLTGETETIDGVTLDRTEYEIVAYGPEGTEIWRSAGREYVSRDWRMFLSGQSAIVTPEDSFDNDEAPVEFIMPGEPGFLSVSPKHGCGTCLLYTSPSPRDS